MGRTVKAVKDHNQDRGGLGIKLRCVHTTGNCPKGTSRSLALNYSTCIVLYYHDFHGLPVSYTRRVDAPLDECSKCMGKLSLRHLSSRPDHVKCKESARNQTDKIYTRMRSSTTMKIYKQITLE